MDLTAEEQAMLAGDNGEADRWAMSLQVAVGEFFSAPRMVPVTGAHLMGDMEVMGDGGYSLLEQLAEAGARARVPTTTNARCVDFDLAETMRQDPELVRKEAALVRLLRRFGIGLTDTCINYQTIYQPSAGEHLAWGDTGTVIYANSVCAARSNFESGPAAVGAALTGRTPAYGFHLDVNRRGDVLIELDAPMRDVTDWGVAGAIVGERYGGYAQVPVFDSAQPARADELKHLGASLASYGSMGMFHMAGVTPEAPSVEAAFDGEPVADRLRITEADIDRHLLDYPGGDQVDVVVERTLEAYDDARLG
jgi:predicted aconitase